MPNILNRIKALPRALLPNGRAFKVPAGGVFARLLDALARSEERAYKDALSALDSAIADNPNFSEEDATEWERRLGIITASGATLSDRVLGINQKLNFPGTDAPRQYWQYLEDQLQAAGFDVHVHENRFPGFNAAGTKSIVDVLAPYTIAGQLGDGQLADFQLGTTIGANPSFFHGVQLGDTQLGNVQLAQTEYYNKIANSLEEQRDAFFTPGSNLRSTFFIGGETLGDFATVPFARKAAFRQLVLQLKPQQTVAYLLINYA